MKDFRLRFILRNKETNEKLEIYNDLLDFNVSVLTFPIDLKEFEIVRIDRPFGKDDINGKPLYENDRVNIYNWGIKDQSLISTTTIVWDSDEGRWSTQDYCVEDPYDFYSKAKIEYVSTF